MSPAVSSNPHIILNDWIAWPPAPLTRLSMALIIINRISQLISQIRDNDQDDMKITVSGGITCYHGTESPDDLIDHANRALQFAVYWGRDRVAGYNYTDPGTES